MLRFAARLLWVNKIDDQTSVMTNRQSTCSQAVAGLIVPTVLLSNLQHSAHFTFVQSLQQVYSGKAGQDEASAFLGRDIKGKGKVA